MLAANLRLIEQQCDHLVEVPSNDDVPEIPENMDDRKIHSVWDDEFIVDYDDTLVVGVFMEVLIDYQINCAVVNEDDNEQDICPILFNSDYYNDRKDDFEVQNTHGWSLNDVDNSNENNLIRMNY